MCILILQGYDFGKHEIIILGSEHDILCLDLKNLTRDEVLSFKFSSFEVAYKIYYWFARFNGFAARKG